MLYFNALSCVILCLICFVILCFQCFDYLLFAVQVYTIMSIIKKNNNHIEAPQKSVSFKNLMLKNAYEARYLILKHNYITSP